MSRLTNKAVDNLFEICMYCLSDSAKDILNVSGIINAYTFNRTKITENTSLIYDLLLELPDEFHINKGGGWSFLNACIDRHGNQWTDYHFQIEKLFCLGIAANKARWMTSRDLWKLLPGGVPYVSVGDMDDNDFWSNITHNQDTIRKWDFEKHEYERVENKYGAVLITEPFDVDKIIRCTNCGIDITVGDSMVSKQWHDNIGLGFPVCVECHQIELGHF